ncbi:MAG: HD domain-containing protein [Candidatus Wolfebacteria bacterium]|nr:HD domain-containing protein [Candidatus Wolfebacteria bacterium]
MKDLVRFFVSAGKLKKIKRRGAMLYGKTEDEVESTAEHTYRMVLMAWILGEGKGNVHICRVLKMALVHDLCEVYAGDITPYDGLLPKDEKKRYAFVRTWPGLTHAKREKRAKEKHKRERAGLEKLVRELNPRLRKEFLDLWLEYEAGRTKEARLVRQIDRLENLIQAVEYFEEDKNFPTKPWWLHAKESIDDPTLLQFMDSLYEWEKKIERGRKSH